MLVIQEIQVKLRHTPLPSAKSAAPDNLSSTDKLKNDKYNENKPLLWYERDYSPTDVAKICGVSCFPSSTCQFAHPTTWQLPTQRTSGNRRSTRERGQANGAATGARCAAEPKCAFVKKYPAD